MFADWGIRPLIISRGRSASISTCRHVPDWFEVLVPTSERQAYESVLSNPVLTVPDEVCGLGALRNWILDNFPEETIIMLDDDVNRLYCLTGPLTKEIKDPDEVALILYNTAVMAKDAGCSVFGYSQTDIRKFDGTNPFALCGWVGCVIGVIGRKLRFRDDPFKVDIDFCLKSLLVDRIVWIDTRYKFDQKRDTNVGGNALFRTQEKFKQSCDSLVRRWGKFLNVKWKQTQISIKLNVPRKQSLDL